MMYFKGGVSLSSGPAASRVYDGYVVGEGDAGGGTGESPEVGDELEEGDGLPEGDFPPFSAMSSTFRDGSRFAW